MKIAVSVVTFSKNEKLVKELNKYFPNNSINTLGRRYIPQELIESLKDADGAIVGLDKIDERILKYCPKLKVISKYGIGTDKINFGDCKKYGIEVLLQNGANKRSVSELTLGFMLGLMRGAYISSVELREGIWNKYNNKGRNLTEKTIGIIGVGNIGKDLVSLLKPFDCKILVNDIRKDAEQKQFYSKNNLIEVSKKEIYKTSDIITIHTPLTELTRNMITKKEFNLMRKDSYIINTARGEIVNEEDLFWALKNKIIAGAALDVYTHENEPNFYEKPFYQRLRSLPNIILTPHMGGTSKEASLALGINAINNLKKYFKIKNEFRE